jgi:preprotein translocase subunit SecB
MTDLPGNGAANGSAPPDELRGSLNVNAQYIKDLSFESPNVLRMMTQPSTSAPEVSLNLGVGVNAVGPESFEVVLSVRAETKRDAIVAFIAELAYAGIFTIRAPQDQLEPILFIEAPRLLFPFARAIIADLTRDGGYTPLMLNPIDFVDLYRRRLIDRQNAGNAGPNPPPN